MGQSSARVDFFKKRQTPGGAVPAARPFFRPTAVKKNPPLAFETRLRITLKCLPAKVNYGLQSPIRGDARTFFRGQDFAGSRFRCVHFPLLSSPRLQGKPYIPGLRSSEAPGYCPSGLPFSGRTVNAPPLLNNPRQKRDFLPIQVPCRGSRFAADLAPRVKGAAAMKPRPLRAALLSLSRAPCILRTS